MKNFRSSASLGLIIFLFFGTVPGFCQERFQIGGHFLLGFPEAEFRDNVEKTGLGGNFYFAYRLPRSMISAGVAVGFLIYGHETRTEPLSPTIPDMIVDVRTTNSILLCHLFLRVQPPRGVFRPYLDGLIGFNYLTTDTSIGDHDGWEDNDLSSNNLSDLALSYGLGGGAM